MAEVNILLLAGIVSQFVYHPKRVASKLSPEKATEPPPVVFGRYIPPWLFVSVKLLKSQLHRG